LDGGSLSNGGSAFASEHTFDSEIIAASDDTTGSGSDNGTTNRDCASDIEYFSHACSNSDINNPMVIGNPDIAGTGDYFTTKTMLLDLLNDVNFSHDNTFSNYDLRAKEVL
jgi:hypothetical protein